VNDGGVNVVNNDKGQSGGYEISPQPGIHFIRTWGWLLAAVVSCGCCWFRLSTVHCRLSTGGSGGSKGRGCPSYR
jgi:hypothetical protein